MVNIEKEHCNKQKGLPLQIVMRTAGALLISTVSGISHQPPGLSSPETFLIVQRADEFSSIPPILFENTAPKPTPTFTPTPEIKPPKKDILREYFAPRIYQEVLKIREQREKTDPNYKVRTNPILNQDRFSVAFLGGRAEDGLSDSIMIATYHLPSDSLGRFSIPRDIGTPEVFRKTGIPGSARINQAYGLGGMEFTKTILENATGLSIDFAIDVDLEGLPNLIDKTVRYVEIDIENDIDDEYYPAANNIDYERFSLKAGHYKIDGKMALKLTRSRRGENNDDYARAKRTREISLAFFKRVHEESKKDLSFVGKFREVLEQEIKKGRIKPDFDIGIIFPAMLGPIPIGLGGDLPGLLWTERFGEGWTVDEMPREFSAGLTRENLIEGAGVPGVAIDKIKGHSYLTEKPLNYWEPSRKFTENFLKRTGGTTFIQR